MEQIVIEFHKQIVKSLPKGLRSRFDILFAQVYALQSPADLLRGLCISKKLAVLKQAIKLLDEECLQNNPSFSIVYTPLVNATFNALIAMAKLKSTSIPEVVAKRKDSKDSAKPTMSQSLIVDVSSDKASLPAKSVEPISKGKPRNVKKPEGQRLANVYADLQTKLSTPGHVFATPAFKFIKCEAQDCMFCRSLFVNFQLTKCVGHHKCTKSGWYPHFGPTLWKRFTKLHTKQQTFEATDRDLKAYELPSFCLYSKGLPSNTPPHRMECNESASEDDTSSVSTVTSSQTSTSSKARKRLFKTSSVEWAEEVDAVLPQSPKKPSPDRNTRIASKGSEVN